MRVKPVYFMPQLEAIKRHVFALQVKRAKKAGSLIARTAKKLIEQTFQYWNQSGENEFKYPVVKTSVKITENFNASQIILTVRVVVIDPSTGDIHYLWHLLDRGRGAYTFPANKKSPPIKARRRRRTRKNTLKVDPFGGFTGETFVIHGGQRVAAVDANNWYEQAAKETIEALEGNPLFESFKPEIEIVKMK